MLTEKSNKILIFLLIVSICVTLLPILIACLYVTPSADDFSNSVAFKGKGLNLGVVRLNLSLTKQVYYNWQGTYSGCILIFIPVYYWFGLVGLRAECVLGFILFFLSLFVCLFSICSLFKIDKEKKLTFSLALFFFCIFFIANFTNITEIFFWHTGLCMYTVPLSFSFLAFSLYLQYNNWKYKKMTLVLGSFIAFIAAGGVLNISAFLCSTLLLFVFFDFLQEKKINPTVIIFIAAFIGAIINTAAPGNFVRQNIIIEREHRSTSLAQALYNSVINVLSYIVSDLQIGIIIPALIIIFIVSYYAVKNSSIVFKYPGLVFIYSLLCCVISVFPVLFGYAGKNLPLRGIFVERVVILFYAIIIMIYWAGWLSKKGFSSIIQQLLNKSFLLGLSVGCFFLILPLLFNPMESKLNSIKMIAHELKGDYRLKALEQENIINIIKNSKEEDIVISIKKQKEKSWTNLKTIGLTDDKDWWINVHVAHFFDKKSIILNIKE